MSGVISGNNNSILNWLTRLIYYLSPNMCMFQFSFLLLVFEEYFCFYHCIDHDYCVYHYKSTELVFIYT